MSIAATTPQQQERQAQPQQQPATGIHIPGSIWAKCIEERASSKTGSKADAHVYFIGTDSSGKSTLTHRFLHPSKAEPARPSPGLEYTYARKAAAYDAHRRDLAHVWEISGGDDLASHLTQGSSHIFLTHRQVTTSVVVVVLDLSDPAGVIPAARHWLSATRARLGATYALFERRGLKQLPQQLRARQRAKVLGQQHPDAQLVDCPGVSLVLACTKWDALRSKAGPETLRLLSRSLRWLAHSNAAHLLYLGDLQPGATGSEGARLLDNFSRLLNHLAFTGMDRRIPLRQQPAFDHLGPLLVPAGSDSFASIGLPHGQQQQPPGGATAGWSAAEVEAGQQAWLEAVERVLPAMPGAERRQRQRQRQQAGQGLGKAAAFSATYREEEVDAAHAQREAALEAYRREQRGTQQQQQQQQQQQWKQQ